MKKYYEKPIVQVMTFEILDIITESIPLAKDPSEDDIVWGE